MPVTRCPVLVGRRAETAALRAGLAAARLGRGGTTALTGPAGIGKSRLAREAGATAVGWGMRHAVGRAVPDSGPFRPLTEALLAALRLVPAVAEDLAQGRGTLAEYRPLLGRVLPRWRTADIAPDEPLVVTAEAVLQLLTAVAGAPGLLLVLEDLHWSDPETLAVVEYLADNGAAGPLALLLTARDEPGPVSRSLRALAERDACERHRLGPLDEPDVVRIAAACTGTDLPEHVRAAVVDRAGGVPLLVEELVAGPNPARDVPVSLAESVAERVAALPLPARRIVEAAAVIGETVDWRLVGSTVGEDAVVVSGAIREAARTGLLDVVSPEVVRFQHALGRDAVLAGLPPPERSRWARRALHEVRRAHPDLDGEWCEIAGDLAVRGGDVTAAAALLGEAGRRSLDRGALPSAERALRRARDLAARPDPRVEADLAETLVRAGRTGDATEVTRSLIELVADDPVPLGEALLRSARIRAAEGDWAAAEAELDRARRCGADRLQVASAAAQVAIGDARPDDARAIAADALREARAAGRMDVVVESLLILGRLERAKDLTAAVDLFTTALAAADAAGASAAAARAEYEIAITYALHDFRLDRIVRARSRVRAAGDLAAAAVLDLHEAAMCVVRWEPERALAAAQRCEAASARLRLATHATALVLGAAAATHLGRHEQADAALADALGRAPDDTHLQGEVWHVRAMRALDRADDRAARRHLDRAVAAFLRRPDEVALSPASGLWTLVSTVADPTATCPPQPPGPTADRCNRGLIRFADAVAAARAGDPGRAAIAFADGDRTLREPVDLGWHRRQARRLVGGAALTDGWGDPGGWSGADLPVVEQRGRRAWAGALRGQLRRAGVAVPRPRRGTATLSARLRALGVTGREADVLTLVAEGRGNREIADRLVLSPRTVEKHVEHLLAKTGHRRRTELVAGAAALLRPDD